MATSIKETGSEFGEVARIRYLHVSKHFWVYKGQEECAKIFEKAGFKGVTHVLAPSELLMKLLNKVEPDQEGKITFKPGELVLGQTEEEVKIPGNESWEMQTYFIDRTTDLVLPLTTNCTAPNLHPYSQGPQTYEILNESKNPIVLDYRNLVCPVKVISLKGFAMEGASTFRKQKKGEMTLGSPYPESHKLRLLAIYKQENI